MVTPPGEHARTATLSATHRAPRLPDVHRSHWANQGWHRIAVIPVRCYVGEMKDPTDAERDELEVLVSDVLYEVAEFAWSDLAERIPVGRACVRPESEGRYMAVTWDADWKGRQGGSILIKVQGFLGPDHKVPTWGAAEIIRKRGFLARLLQWKVA